jgi:hypothetical protein
VPDVEAVQVVAVEGSDDNRGVVSEDVETIDEDDVDVEDEPFQSERVRRAPLSTTAGSVYSGFAMGFFDPQQAVAEQPISDRLVQDVEQTEFELVTVEDASNGRRAAGGTQDNEDTVPLGALSEATSD